jgi:hypothetical protein
MRQIRYGNAIRALLFSALCGTFAFGLGACGGGGGGGGGAAPATVLGRVVVLSGTPVSGVTVTIGGRQFVTGTGSIGLGNFSLTNVPSDATTITVSGTGVKTLTQTLEPLTPNATNDLGDIFVIDAADSETYTANVTGVVVRNDTLAPVAGAKVRLSGHVTTTGADGAFSFTGLPTGLGLAGTPVGDVTATGFTKSDITLGGLVLGASPPVNDLGNIVIAPVVGPTPDPPTNIKGKVSLTGQTDLSGTTVTLTLKSDGSTVDTMVTKADGVYGFFVAANTYTVKVQHAGFTDQQADVTLTRPDKVQTKDFTLAP